MKIDDFTFVQKSGYVLFEKMGQDLSHNLYFKSSFYVFEAFYAEVTRQVTLASSEEMQSSSSGSIKRTRSLFL